MNESYYQAKIMKEWEAIGGHNVNGNYTKSGEADLQGGYPHTDMYLKPTGDKLHPFKSEVEKRIRLLYLVVEVKTEEDYARVMKCIVEENGRYVIQNTKGLKKHEPLQIAKINMVRDKGGLAVIAWNFKQVQDYVTARV